MSFFINPFQLLERGVGIDLCRVDTLMTQQFLDALKSCAIVQHRRGESVPEHVGRAFLQGSDQRQVLMHDHVHLVSSHPSPLIAQEQSTILAMAELFLPDSNVLT